ncbi:MAG: DsrE family protein [Desulfobacterales bacterium]|jgi:predicted peroxiredoxin
MTDQIVITIACGTDDPNRSTRGLMLAMAAHKEGKKVSVFLLDEGVNLAREGVVENLRAATGDSADDHMAYLQAHGVPILVCTPCAAARQLKPEDMVEGAQMAVAADLVHLSCEGASINL